MFARFAQEYGGQKLHIVEADANDKTVSARAISGIAQSVAIGE